MQNKSKAIAVAATLLLAVGAVMNHSALMAADTATLPKPDAHGFITLFNGKDLTGWAGMEGFWSVKDGAITGSETKDHPVPHNTFLIYTPSKFGDFELRLKFKINGGNSGVQFRSKVLNEKESIVGGYQADFDGGRGYDGTIYDEAGVAGGRGTMGTRGDKIVWNADGSKTAEKLAKSSDEIRDAIKLNDWNDYVIVAKGNHLVLSINGNTTTDVTDDSPKAVSEGVIALQLHAGFVMEVQFKDIKIKLLK